MGVGQRQKRGITTTSGLGRRGSRRPPKPPDLRESTANQPVRNPQTKGHLVKRARRRAVPRGAVPQMVRRWIAPPPPSFAQAKPIDRGLPPIDRGLPPIDRGLPPMDGGPPPIDRGLPTGNSARGDAQDRDSCLGPDPPPRTFPCRPLSGGRRCFGGLWLADRHRDLSGRRRRAGQGDAGPDPDQRRNFRSAPFTDGSRQRPVACPPPYVTRFSVHLSRPNGAAWVFGWACL